MILKKILFRARDHPFWWHSTAKQMPWMTILLVHSLVPSDCGWYAVDIFSLMPVSACRAFQKQEMKSLLWSDMILRGRPFSQYHSLKKSSASSFAFNVVVVGTSQMSELRQSVRVRMQSKPCSTGNGCYISTRRLPDLGKVVLRISLVRTTSAYFKQRRASKQ